MKKLILRNFQSPGDIVMLTATVRDLHIFYPDQFLTDVRTPCPALWANNPYLTALDERDPDVDVVECQYPLIHHSNAAPYHFIHGFTEFLNEQLDLNIRPTVFRGDIHLSAREQQARSPLWQLAGEDRPYWLIAAGGKRDYTIKWWDHGRFQEVVDRLRGRVQFVQIGSVEHHHQALDGVIDLRGKTDLRQLIQLVYHSQGAVTPVSLLMHLAAAVEMRGQETGRPCVVIAGGREPTHWEAYPQHQFIHTIGALRCCSSGGCWKSRAYPLGDGDEKDQPGSLCVDLVRGLPRCMAMITAEEVVRRIESYFVGGRLPRRPAIQPALPRIVSVTAPAAAHAAPRPVADNPPEADSQQDGILGLEGRQADPAGAPRDRSPRVSVCILTYGDYPHLTRRSVDSILKHCPRERFRLIVGANEPGPETLSYLGALCQDGAIDRFHLSATNINKCPMMRRMVADIDTPFTWWFDDDCYITEDSALERWLAVADRADDDVVMWGSEWFFHHAGEFAPSVDIEAWIKTAAWYRGRPVPPGGSDVVSEDRWRFLQGGCWMIRTAALHELDWPDPRLIRPFEDVVLGEAIRQQGWRLEDNGLPGSVISNEPRRGPGEDMATILRQIGGGASG